MFLTRLKRETLTQHTAIERRVDLRRICASRAAYTAHLARMYGFYRPLEQAIWSPLVPQEAGLGEERRKTPALARDLGLLGVVPADLPLCRKLPPLTSPAETLGVLYVLEGATLGGQVITRLVHDRLGIEPAAGGAFFHGYGEATGAMWESFRTLLSGYAGEDEARQSAMIGAARATFETLDAWLSAAGQEEERVSVA